MEAKYAAAIKKGDDAFASKTWSTARTGYNEALGFKPAEQYPKDKLAAIDKAIADEKLNMDAAAKAKAEAELKAKYDAVTVEMMRSRQNLVSIKGATTKHWLQTGGKISERSNCIN